MASPSELVRTLLIVEDDQPLRHRLALAFSDLGFDTREAGDYAAAMAAAGEESPEYMLVDLRMPGHSGLDVIRDVKALDAGTICVVLTGYGSIATALEAVRIGAADYLTKPADVDAILAAFDRGDRLGPTPAGLDENLTVPSLARVEWEHISRVVTDCGGNISKAARMLGLHRRSLQRKLSKNPVSR